MFGTVIQSKYACQRHLLLKHVGPNTGDWDFDLVSTETKDEQTNGPRSQQKAMPPMTGDVQIMLRAKSFEMLET